MDGVGSDVDDELTEEVVVAGARGCEPRSHGFGGEVGIGDEGTGVDER